MRKNIRFLKSYNFIKSPRCQRLREHILQGHTYPSGNVGGWHHIHGNASQNNFGRIDNIVEETDPRGYYTAHVSIKNTDGVFIKKITKIKQPDGSIIKVPQKNDMFPRNWEEQELLENISLAYTTKVYTGEKNQFIGSMSDGKRLMICINGNTNTIDATTNIKTVWPNRNN